MPKYRQTDKENVKSHSYYNYENYQLKPWRKLLHMSSSWIAFVFIYTDIKLSDAKTILIIASFSLIIVDILRIHNDFFKKFFSKKFKELIIDRDNGRLNSATWYIISATIVVFLFGKESNRLTAGIPILYLAFGDTAASFFGKKFGVKKLPILRGTWIGFVSCFTTCFIINIFYFDLLISSITALVVSIAEALPIQIDDNISMVVLGAITLNIIT